MGFLEKGSFEMNWEQVKGVVERIATIGFGYAAGRGWIPADIVGSLVTVVVTIGSIAWGIWVNTPTQLEKALEKM